MSESARSLNRMSEATLRGSRVRHLVAGVAVVGALGLGAMACSDPDPVIPRAAIISYLGPGQNPPAGCGRVSGAWVMIGDNAKPVNDGDSQNGASVRVACAVVPAGDGFTVTAGATLSGAGEASGTVTISGRMTPTGEQKGIEVTFQKDTGSFTQSDCTVTYKTTLQTVAAGRVWGNVTCPKAVDTGKSLLCEGTAEFKFENCQQ